MESSDLPSLLNRITQIDSRLRSTAVPRSCPDMQVLDRDYGYGQADGMDPDLCAGMDRDGRDLPEGDDDDDDDDNDNP